MRRTLLALSDPLRKNDALFVFGATRELPFVHAYVQQKVEVVHGPSCRPDNEIHLDRCREDGVPVIARRGGGGTVVLSPGMVIVVVVGARPGGEIRDTFTRVQNAMIALLQPMLTIRLEQAGVSDIVAGHRKVCGSSLYLPRQASLFCYQASLMVASRIELISRYLKHPPREPDYRARRPHEHFCVSLHALGLTSTPEQTAELLRCDLRDGVAAQLLTPG
jgi:lipoate---protein ligase